MLIPINVSKTLYAALADVRNLEWQKLADKITNESAKFVDEESLLKALGIVTAIRNAATQNLDEDFETHYVNYVALFAILNINSEMRKSAITVETEFAKFHTLIEESLRHRDLTVRLMSLSDFHRHQELLYHAITLNGLYPGLDCLKELSWRGLVPHNELPNSEQIARLLTNGCVTYVVMPNLETPQIGMTPKGRELYGLLPLLKDIHPDLARIFFGAYLPTY